MILNNFLRSSNVNISIRSSRYISTSSVNHGMRSFNKFVLVRRGTEAEKKRQKENPDPKLQYTGKKSLLTLKEQ